VRFQAASAAIFPLYDDWAAGADYPEPCGFTLLDGGLDSLQACEFALHPSALHKTKYLTNGNIPNRYLNIHLQT
jgi:hypothetical protein